MAKSSPKTPENVTKYLRLCVSSHLIARSGAAPSFLHSLRKAELTLFDSPPKTASVLAGFAANSSMVSPPLWTLSVNVTPDVAEVAFGALFSCRITAFSKDLRKDKHQPRQPDHGNTNASFLASGGEKRQITQEMCRGEEMACWGKVSGRPEELCVQDVARLLGQTDQLNCDIAFFFFSFLIC